MSALLERPVTKSYATVTDVPVIPSHRIPVGPIRRPVIDFPAPAAIPVHAPTQAPARPRVASKVARFVFRKSALFTVIFLATYVTSTESGQYMVEQSRTQGIEAMKRSNAAVESEKAVQRRLDALKSEAAVEEWALSHGFRPADGLGQTSKV